ncbi:hypothetical protein PG995_014872 [Apiospora arundinis]
MTSADRDQVLKWLKTSDPENNHGLARVYHEPGTGDWIIQDEQFNRWKAASGDQLLWIYGIPGAGKTIICSSIIDHMQKHCAQSAPKDAIKPLRVVYFYFDFSDRNKQSLRALLESIALQLVSDGGDISETVTSLFEHKNKGRIAPSLEELLNLIIAEVLRTEITFLVIDALDECPEPERRILFDQFLQRLLQANIKILITSRKVSDIEHAIDTVDSHSICIQDSVVDADIRKHISSHISQDDDFASWDSDLKGEVVDGIVAGAKGMFRWAICQIDSMKDCRDAAMARDRLKTMPTSLDEMYDRILDAIPAEKESVVKSALQWLAFSNRPMLLEELATAVVVRPSLQEHGQLLGSGRLSDEQTIADLCGVLVKRSTLVMTRRTPDWVRSIAEVESRGQGLGWPEKRPELTKIALSHYSVKEYLVSERFRNGKMSRFAASVTEAHAFMAQCCLQYLLDFNRGSTAASLDYIDNPLLGYAARHWMSHYELAGEAGNIAGVRPFVERLFNLTSQGPYINWLNAWDIERTWLPEAHGHYRMGETKRSVDLFPQPLYWAAALGDTVLVTSLLEQGASQERVQGVLGSALGVAAFRGHADVVDLFLSRGADPDRKSPRFGSVLQIAALGGSEAVVKRLIEAGADVNARGGDYETALLAAASKQHETVVSLLARSGADLDSGDSKASTWSKGSALYQAAAAGDMNLTNILLKAGADVNGPDAAATGTPLLGAAKSASLGIVQLLIRKGADVNRGSEETGYPLIEAAGGWGQDEQIRQKIILALLNAGADPNVKGRYEETALCACIRSKTNMVIFQALLDAGADVNAGSVLSGSCLKNAIRLKAFDIVKILKARGAKISDESLIPAVRCYHEAPWVLEAVLATDPDVNLREADSSATTPLHAALEGTYRREDEKVIFEYANKDAAFILLARGAYVDAIDWRFECTPLCLALKAGLVDIVKEMIRLGADIHRAIASSPFEMAIEFARREAGTLQLADMLLNHGVDINKDTELAPYITFEHKVPELGVTEAPRLDVLEYLVKRGLDINRKMKTKARPRAVREFDGTPIQYAAEHGDIPTIKKLLELGAQVDSTAGVEGHTLHYAIMSKNASVVEFLLDLGAKVEDVPEGKSIVVKAIRNELDGLVGRLVDLGADVNATERGESPLSAAFRAGNKDLVDLLRSRGARFSDTDHEVAKEIIEKGDLEELRTLLKYGLDPNLSRSHHSSKSECQYAPVEHASKLADTAAIQLLLDYGADLGRDAFAGVLSGVCKRGDMGMATFLMDHGALTHLEKALELSVGVKSNEAIVETLLGRGAKVQLRTLECAIRKGDTSMAARLLEEEIAPVDRKDWLGKLLQEAAYSGHLDLCSWLMDVHGADVNHSGEPYGSPLRAALSGRSGRSSREPLVDLLLAHGAEVNPPPAFRGKRFFEREDSWKQWMFGKRDTSPTFPSPLYLSFSKEWLSFGDNLPIARKLLALGADPNLVGGGLHTSLQNAVANCPSLVELLLDAGADVNAVGGRLGTALHVAAWKKDINSIKLLLSRGADVHIVAGRYGTVLQAGALQKDLPSFLARRMRDVDREQTETNEVMDALLEAGADPYRVDAGKYGSVAQTAAVKGNVPALKWLRETVGPDLIRAKGHGVWGNAYRAAHKNVWRSQGRTANWHVISWLEQHYGHEGWDLVDFGHGGGGVSAAV